ncbi:hypothetical protein FAM09_01230 [Niastella caeni]|uniref:Uncharacterized protein n=1 Tax=Niastella caeni TaxID=2569763 RepID=A0A4S8HYZ6_9BACT|nr:hypothetical protein [Niastella caeni]THU40765.1 hypothetical protein FAM09_01230 [Niastella caeni]
MESLYLHFDTPLADANKLAEDLQSYLANTQQITLARIKDNDNAQDFGATLVLVLGTPAILAIAKGIQTWLSKRNNITITIKNSQGEVVASGISGKDIPKVFEGAEKLI